MTNSDQIPERRFHDGWFLPYCAGCQNGYLRLIDDWRAHYVSKSTHIGQRKGAALDLIRPELVHPGAISQIVNRFGQTRQIQQVCIPDYRHDEVAGRKSSRHANVDVFLHDNTIAIHGHVDQRKIADGPGNSFDKNRGKGDLSPYCFWNESLMRSLHWTISVTSTSTKEVTCAEVCLDMIMWSAIRRRIRSISMISTWPSEEEKADGADGLTAGFPMIAGAAGAKDPAAGPEGDNDGRFAT